jgi:hypothetical protein
MKVDPIKDAAHPTGTHETPGEAGSRGAGDTSSGEEEIVNGRNPTQRKIDAERKSRPGPAGTPAEASQPRAGRSQVASSE